MSQSSRSQRPPAPVEIPVDWTGDEVPLDGRLLGIDFGTRRLGLALSTPEQSMSCPLDTWERTTAAVEARRLRDLDEDYRIVGYVVGLPLHMNGDESDSSRKACEYGRWLRQQTGRPVAFWDERCTSAAADQWMHEAELTRDRRKAVRDRLAAHVILQSFLDARQRNDDTA